MTHDGPCARIGLFTAILVLLSDPLVVRSAPLQSGQRERIDKALATLSQKVPQASRPIGWIRKSVSDAVPEAAVKGLESLADALGRIEGAPALEMKKVIEAVEEDLAIKAAVCRVDPKGMAVLVPVVVHTWSSNEPRSEVPRWNVHYLIAPLALIGDLPGESFPAFSSPTSISLPPGRYVVWAQDPQNSRRRGPRRDITLGSKDGTVPAAGVRADVIIAEK